MSKNDDIPTCLKKKMKTLRKRVRKTLLVDHNSRRIVHFLISMVVVFLLVFCSISYSWLKIICMGVILNFSPLGQDNFVDFVQAWDGFLCWRSKPEMSIAICTFLEI